LQRKKSIWILVSLLAVALGLIAALVVVRSRFAPPGEEGPDPGPTVLVYQTQGAVTSLKITQEQKTSFTLSALSLEEDLVEDASLGDYDSQLVNQSRVTGVLNASRHLYALELLEESPGDYQSFGLAQPRAVVEVTDETKRTITLLIGDNAPGNAGIYLKRQDSPAIYLVPAYSLDNYLLPETAYLNLTITPGSVAEGFDAVVLGGTVREEQGQVVIRRQGEEYALSAPVQRPLDESMGLALLNTLLGLNADSVAAINPTREELEALGLNRPYATAQVSGSWGEFFLSATAPDAGGMVYLYREGVPLLYTARADLLPWLDLQYIQLMDPFAYTPDIEQLQEISLDLEAGQSYRFQLARSETGELSVTLDGAAIDSENFLRFYVTLISARLAEHTQQPSSPGNPALVITYTHHSGERQWVEFYPGPPRRWFIRTGNLPFFLTPSTYLERVLQDLEKIQAGHRVESFEW
jgi:hypothetical protein